MSVKERSSAAVEQLRARCQELESLLQSAQESDRAFLRQVVDINPHFVFAKDRQGRFTLVNRAVAEAYGTTVDDLIGKTDADFNSNLEEVEHFRRDDLEVMDNLREKFIPEEVITDADGRTRWLQTIKRPIVGPDGRADQVLGVATDITVHKALEQQLAHAALHDALTGLPNRVLFRDRLAVAVERAKRSSGSQFAVLFLDLDRFKLINDSLGHDLGDRLLVAAARRIERCVRPGDTVARLGGDEFTLLLTDLDGPRDAVLAAEAIHRVLAEPFPLLEREVYLTASVGIAVKTAADQQPDDILRDADTAMYRAKALGRGRQVVFDPTMHALAVAQLELENDLRRGLERGELCLVYQPIVRLTDGRVVECEALLRWRHPRRGLLPPEQFLPVAEESGMLLALEQWALTEACHQAAGWLGARPGAQPWGVSLNLSGRQFAGGEPAQRVTEALAASGLPGDLLRLEITETAILDRHESVAEVLQELHALGVRIDVDDFGTGYSSLSYLHRLPVDRLKIDRSFVQRLDAEGDAGTIVHTIITLARALGIEAIAEGVETGGQLRRVRELGCDHAQGHLFSLPLPADEVVARLPAAYDLSPRGLGAAHDAA